MNHPRFAYPKGSSKTWTKMGLPAFERVGQETSLVCMAKLVRSPMPLCVHPVLFRGIGTVIPCPLRPFRIAPVSERMPYHQVIFTPGRHSHAVLRAGCRPPLQIRIAPYNKNRTSSESCFCVYYMKIPLNTGVSKIIEKNTKTIKEKKSYISHEFLIGLQKFKSTSARLSSYRTNLGSFSKASSSSAQQRLSIKTTASLQIFSLS